MLYELGYGCVESVSVQTGQYGHYGIVLHGRTYSFDRTPFYITQKRVAITLSVVRSPIVIWHVHANEEDVVLPGVTGHYWLVLLQYESTTLSQCSDATRLLTYTQYATEEDST